MEIEDFFLSKIEEPPFDLKEKILKAIYQAELKKAQRSLLKRTIGFGCLAIISFPYSWLMFLEDLRLKGFWYFFSSLKDFLLNGVFIKMFKEFFLAFLEFLPLSSLLMVFLNTFFVISFLYFFFLFKNSRLVLNQKIFNFKN